MEDTIQDQDSDSSSTSSWILLSNEEATEDMALAKKNHISLKLAVHKLSEMDPKIHNSDIESDGISIISDGEFSHDGRSDDETAIISDEEKSENTSGDFPLLAEDEEFTQKFLNEDIEETYLDYEEDLDSPSEETGSISEEINETLVENVYGNVLDEDIKCIVAKLEEVENTEDSSDQYLTQTIDYRKLLTCPSLICTSVVIFAVILFPYFSSRINGSNTLEHQNVEEYDLPILPEKEIVGVDPLAYCKEIYKDNNLYNDHNMKKCVKKIMKHLKKAEKKGEREINSIDLKNDELIVESTKTNFNKIQMNYGRINEKENNRDNKRQKYLKKYKYNINGHDGSLEEPAEPHELKISIAEMNEITLKLEEKEKQLLEKERYLKKLEQELQEREQKLEKSGKAAFKYQQRKNSKGRKIDDKENMGKTLHDNKKKYKKEAPIKRNQENRPKDVKTGKKHIEKDRIKDKEFFHREQSGNFRERNNFLHNQNMKQNTGKYFKMHKIPKTNSTKLYEDDNVTVSGDWYLNLVRARQDIRKKEDKALWWFDRAEFRKNKRNKAYWYFQYMFNRENLRYRPKNF